MNRRATLPRNVEEFAHVLYPEEAQEPILGPATRAALLEWLEEIWAEDALAEVGLKPRRRALFFGPPGGGKTTLAHHLAARLGYPLAVVDGAQLISKYLGESGQNIAALFDAVEASGPYALFFDEFDSIGQKRNSTGQGADNERNAYVNILLQRIERHGGLLIAATNRQDEIDPAIWRRFELQIGLGLPGQEERERILARYLHPYGLPDAALMALARDFKAASPALMRQFCEGLKRQLIIGPKVGWDMAREAVIARLLAAVEPHPDLTRPPLWAAGINAAGVKDLPWPLERHATEGGAK